ncbi:hypothetical protein [Gloeobacter kilaueensis]|uniref:Uncharacterized protein n=1 Tax=Gloeobacter kilaueensis (strain ATCC BAA-2537 / CCAP 1431/1 / ULC 316 / JS1) TaxID=1183438 RepID=U5QCT6_GLOK1|nr:hypothetical protein [Gloeobacter kilaueensis]AGY56732.1 hypothetical protein GKIL_0486 [Gloeobacter kilaueensis JS1]
MIEQALIVVLFGLLLAITGGVVYLSWIEFRDRRRRKANKSVAPPPPPARRQGKNKPKGKTRGGR